MEIRHYIIIPKENNSLPHAIFQGFSRSLIEEFSQHFAALAVFPKSISYPFLSDDQLIARQSCFGHQEIVIMNHDVTHEELPFFSYPFNCIWSSTQTFDCANFFSLRFDHPPLHFSSEIGYLGSISLAKLGQCGSKFFILPWLKALLSTVADENVKSLIEELLENDQLNAQEKSLPFQLIAHNCIIPPARVLTALGYKLESRISPVALNNESYIKSVLEINQEIDSCRGEVELLSSHALNDALIYCPSMYAHLHSPNSRMFKNFVKNYGKTLGTILKKGIFQNEGYSNFQIETKESNFPDHLKPIMPAIFERKKELILFSEAIGIFASSQALPAIRLPNGIMNNQDTLRKIALLNKSTAHTSMRKLKHEFAGLSEDFFAVLGTDLFHYCFENRKKLLIVSDFPVEWVLSSGLPVMFSHEVSRVCPTPGDLFLQVLLSMPKISVTSSYLRKILIIRSFKDSDPIKNHLDIWIKNLPNAEDNRQLQLKIIDVESVEEMLQELKSFTGGIVIFDCHGGHGGDTQPAWLQIGESRFHPWLHREALQLPPIVILSACSTHPVDGSHASVANGMLNCGAMAVIGTHARIDSRHAAKFVGRILHRVQDFVPIVAQRRPISWREIVSGFLRMSFISDILRSLEEKELLTLDKGGKIQLDANLVINGKSKDWWNVFLQSIIKNSEIPETKLKELIKDEIVFTPTMLFSQVGRPENIVVYDC